MIASDRRGHHGVKRTLTFIPTFGCVGNALADWGSAVEAFQRGDYKDAIWAIDPFLAGVLVFIISVIFGLVSYHVGHGIQSLFSCIVAPRRERKLARLNSVASTMGLSAQLDGRVPREVGTFKLDLNHDVVEFSLGEQVLNLMYGSKNGVDVLVFDQEEVSEEGEEAKKIVTSSVLFSSPAMNLPQFYLCPDTLPSSLRSARKSLGFQNIKFTEYPTFSDHYRLTGDERGVRVVFTNRVIEHFSENPSWSLEGYRQMLRVYKEGKQRPIGGYPRLMEEGLSILRLFR